MKTTFARLALVSAVVLALPSTGRAAGATNAPASGGTNAPQEDSDSYRLVQMDKLFFRIDQDPAAGAGPEAALVVNSRGMIEVPVSRGYDTRIFVLAKGKTVAEVKKQIKKELEAQFYKVATITMYVEQSSVRPGTVTFYGEIKGPMALPPGQPKYLSEAVLEMHPSEYANLKKVELQRIDPVTKSNHVFKIDVNEILSKNKKDKDMVLQDGDVINIKAKMVTFQ
jgi:protein involved in polysaccharide export with SLBB domain